MSLARGRRIIGTFHQLAVLGRGKEGFAWPPPRPSLSEPVSAGDAALNVWGTVGLRRGLQSRRAESKCMLGGGSACFFFLPDHVVELDLVF